ncbi:hypothetical protein LAZ67_22000148 [Cordylochernes scorpioides]|uniref:Transposase n=1 Tax=Cordylochernes scorpioides TaxID=51811 RepID=A0ABY6LP35_9ARAC|nr:hypothetical protein LAZ67_22000148 [Cordylochernes scorpioides]
MASNEFTSLVSKDSTSVILGIIFCNSSWTIRRIFSAKSSSKSDEIGVTFGLSYTTIMQKYKISKTTVYDIKKSELKLTKFVDSTEKDVKKFSQVNNPLYENVDKAVNIWYESQRLSGVPIRGIELQTAATRGGWLSRYRARHNLKNKKVVGEALSADEDAANRFKDDFHKLMTDEKYEQFQIYNADETGV